jgi:hypothetical protein
MRGCAYRSADSSSLRPARLARAARMAHSSRSSRLSLSAVAGLDRALKTVSSEKLSEQELKNVLARPRIDFTSIHGTVRAGAPRLLPPPRAAPPRQPSALVALRRSRRSWTASGSAAMRPSRSTPQSLTGCSWRRSASGSRSAAPRRRQRVIGGAALSLRSSLCSLGAGLAAPARAGWHRRPAARRHPGDGRRLSAAAAAAPLHPPHPPRPSRPTSRPTSAAPCRRRRTCRRRSCLPR